MDRRFCCSADQPPSRRSFLLRSGGGLGALALAKLLDAESSARASGPAPPRLPHFRPRVQRVIYLFLHGGPSHVDLFDPKPALTKYAGQPLPESFGAVMTRRKVAENPLLAPARTFRPRGESGLEISDFLPELASRADDLCILRSCHGDSVNHPQSVYQMNTGSILMGRPSLGSWVSYGLGTDNDDMPAFVVMPDPGGGLKGGPPAWGSGFLPADHQGTAVRAGERPILHLQPPPGMDDAEQRRVLDLVGKMNARHLAEREFDDQLAARVSAYELAFRMQAEAPSLVDLSQETEETLRLYGVDRKESEEFGRRCLLGRRLLESGVRFVQIYSGDTNGWDAHESIEQNHAEYCRRTDRAMAGLLTDLKRRGLWDDTLVIIGGEFGRMPMSEQGVGRDHNPWGYSVLLSGGGVRGGFAYGATDEIGLRAETDRVHVRDLHATILHLLGVDHERFTFFHNGLDERLTGTERSRVVHEVLA